MTGLSAIGAFLGAAVSTAWLLGSGMYSMLDIPNDRSLHSMPTPRSGGIALLIGIVLGMVVLWATTDNAPDLAIILALGILAAVSVWDDLRGTPIIVRLCIHFLAAAIFLTSGLVSYSLTASGDLIPQVVIWLGVMFFLVWMTNLFNFMDGMDGFAGGMAIIGFSTFGCLAWIADSPLFMALSFVIAAAAAGFLLFNFPPARIFMGDTGSSVLGFLAGAFMLWADRLGLFSIWIGLMVFSPFIVDATVTLLRRLISGERVWMAHKTHYYQRLVQLGWGHRKTTLVEYGLMLVSAVGAVFAAISRPTIQWALVVFFVAMYSMAAVMVRAMERRVENCTCDAKRNGN